jgi:hypothetical protein
MAKTGGEIIVQTRTKKFTRKAVEPGTKKHEASLKKQYNRTPILNNLASEINKVITLHSDNHKHSRFYNEVHSRLRKEPENKRFLLLLQLKNLDIHPRYPLRKLGQADVSVKAVKNKGFITVTVKYHPHKIRNANCYYYEVLLMMWNKTNKPAIYKRQLSDWVDMKKGNPEFDFEFEKPAGTTHWLVCLRQRLGIDDKLISSFETDGMQIVAVGSFDRKEQKLMDTHRPVVKSSSTKKNSKKEEEVHARVKAKRIN